MVELEGLVTEAQNQNTIDLDCLTPLEIAQAMNAEDKYMVAAVEKVLPQVAVLIEWCTITLKQGGRILYMGAGTSGRIGVLDAVECPPTFGTSPEQVVGLIAGGENAFIKAVEGAEDSTTLGEMDLKEIQLTSKDIVIGIAASGRTPYVIHALRYAKKIGCKTAAIACNRNSAIGKEADLSIEVVVGPEVLTGSTRLKAGSAQKMILNMVSTGTMVGIGKVYRNLMVDVMQTNDKLEARAENIVMSATNCDREVAKRTLAESKGKVKPAIIMILRKCAYAQAEEALRQHHGYVRNVLEQHI